MSGLTKCRLTGWHTLVLLVILSGCATNPMALKPDMASLDTSQKSVVLFTLKTSNAYVPKYVPEVRGVWVRKETSSGPAVTGYAVGEPFRKAEEDYNEYLISLPLKPGKQMITSMDGRSYRGLVFASFYYMPKFELDIQPGNIVYMGRIELVNRKQTGEDGQVASGPPLPLIDQSVAGFSNGYFDVTLTDDYDSDMELFRQQYPVLEGREVTKDIFRLNSGD